MVANTETAIFERIIKPQADDLPPEAAHFMLRLNFTSADHERMENLSEKASEGSLSVDEQQELDGYLHVSDFLVFMQSKARLPLQRRGMSA